MANLYRRVFPNESRKSGPESIRQQQSRRGTQEKRLGRSFLRTLPWLCPIGNITLNALPLELYYLRVGFHFRFLIGFPIRFPAKTSTIFLCFAHSSIGRKSTGETFGLTLRVRRHPPLLRSPAPASRHPPRIHYTKKDGGTRFMRRWERT